MTDSRVTPQSDYDARVHYNAALIGGFMGTATVFGLAGGFGNGWTGNAVAAITNAFLGNTAVWVSRVIGALLYMSAIAYITWAKKHTPNVNMKYLSLVAISVASVVLAFIPNNLPAPVGLYPTFISMSFLWCAFPGAYGFSCACIFNTNNMRQFTIGLAEVFLNGNESHRLRFKFYGLTLLFFHLGVVLMCVLQTVLKFGKYAVLAAIPLCAVMYININTKPKQA